MSFCLQSVLLPSATTEKYSKCVLICEKKKSMKVEVELPKETVKSRYISFHCRKFITYLQGEELGDRLNRVPASTTWILA